MCEQVAVPAVTVELWAGAGGRLIPSVTGIGLGGEEFIVGDAIAARDTSTTGGIGLLSSSESSITKRFLVLLQMVISVGDMLNGSGVAVRVPLGITMNGVFQ